MPCARIFLYNHQRTSRGRVYGRALILRGEWSASPSLISLLSPRRTIVQSTGSTTGHPGGSSGCRSLLDQYTDYQRSRRLVCNARGNAYRFQRKLWPSTEALEASMTAEEFDSVERTPLPMLPHAHYSPSLPSSAAENSRLPAPAAATPHRVLLAQPASPTPVSTAVLSPEAELATIEDKILRREDLSGTPLASLMPLSACPPTTDFALPKATDPAGTTWSELSLDPIVSHAARMYLKAHATTPSTAPTKLQSRLIPTLLHEDHHDVIFNAPKGSGGTLSLVLAVVQGIRAERTGMNVLVAKDTLSAMKLRDMILALGRTLEGSPYGRGSGSGVHLLVDCDGGEASSSASHKMPPWLYMCTYLEEVERCYGYLQKSLRNPHGAVRLLITTADVMCELLFQKKLEFQAFGYLRRVYMDDVASQIPLISPDAPVEEARERLRNPLAAELLLGTLHQLPGPHIRSILQLGLVSDGMSLALKNHLHALCIKLDSHRSVLSSVRLPTTVYTLFSTYHPYQNLKASHTKDIVIKSGLLASSGRYHPTAYSTPPSSHYLWWSSPALQELRQTLTFTAEILWKARDKIPGRVLLFVQNGTDLLRARMALRAAGVDAKLLSEVYRKGSFLPSSPPWKFLLLTQQESILLESAVIPYVSHVMICFAPASVQAYLHMGNNLLRSTAESRNVGWLWVVTPASASKQIREVVEALDIDFIHHHVDENLKSVPSEMVDRRTRPPTLYGLDPQFVVQRHYEVQSENPDVSYVAREFFSPVKNKNKAFQMEDYTPVPVQMRSYKNARKLARDVEANPGKIVQQLQKQGMLTPTLKPTSRLRDVLKQKSQ